MGSTSRQLALGALVMAQGHYQRGRFSHSASWCAQAADHARAANDPHLAEFAERCADVAESATGGRYVDCTCGATTHTEKPWRADVYCENCGALL